MSTLEDILARARAKSKTNQDNRERPAKPKPGKSVWRILPGWRKGEPNEFFHPFGMHYVKDAEGKIKSVLVCPDNTFNQPCEICDAISEAAKAAPSDETRKLILESRSRQVFLMNVIEVETGENKILEVGSMVFNGILDIIEEYGTDFLSPSKGNDIIIDRSGTGMSTKYTVTVRPTNKSIQVQKSHILGMKNLDEYVKEDFEAKKVKALDALGASFAALGIAGGAAGVAALTDGTGTQYDDSLPTDMGDTSSDLDIDLGGDSVEHLEAPAEEKAAPADSFGDDVSDDDLDALLEGIG